MNTHTIEDAMVALTAITGVTTTITTEVDAAAVTDDHSKIERRTPTAPTASHTEDLNAMSEREAEAREVDAVASEEATTPGPQPAPANGTTMSTMTKKSYISTTIKSNLSTLNRDMSANTSRL